MKNKILTSLLGVILAAISFGQTNKDYYTPSSANSMFARIIPKTTLFLPTGCGAPSGIASLKSDTTNRAAIYVDTCGHKSYVWDPSLKEWEAVGGADSAVFATLYRLLRDSAILSQRTIDSAAALRTAINTKLNRSDTTDMLSGYTRSGNLANGSKLDTTTLQPRFNSKVNIGDTSAMLANLLRKSDTVQMLSGYARIGNIPPSAVTVSGSNGIGITGSPGNTIGLALGDITPSTVTTGAITATGVLATGDITADNSYFKGYGLQALGPAAVNGILQVNTINPPSGTITVGGNVAATGLTATGKVAFTALTNVVLGTNAGGQLVAKQVVTPADTADMLSDYQKKLWAYDAALGILSPTTAPSLVYVPNSLQAGNQIAAVNIVATSSLLGSQVAVSGNVVGATLSATGTVKANGLSITGPAIITGATTVGSLRFANGGTGGTDVTTIIGNVLSTGNLTIFGPSRNNDTLITRGDIVGREVAANKVTDFTTVNDTLYPSVRAAKIYMDALVVGLVNDRGNHSASGNTYPSSGGSGSGGAILKGDLYFISAAGVLSGDSIFLGDQLRALVNSPGSTASNWAVMRGKVPFTPENVSNKSTNTSLGSSDVLYPTQKAVQTYVNNGLSAYLSLSGGTMTGSITVPNANYFKVNNGADYVTLGGLGIVINNNSNSLSLQAANLSATRVQTFQNATGTVALTNGAGASGTWGIDITGNAATSTTSTLAANSSLLQGYSANTGGIANTIALRDGSGQLRASYYYDDNTAVSTSGMTSVYGGNGDKFMYKFSANALKTFAGYYIAGDNVSLGSGTFGNRLTANNFAATSGVYHLDNASGNNALAYASSALDIYLGGVSRQTLTTSGVTFAGTGTFNGRTIIRSGGIADLSGVGNNTGISFEASSVNPTNGAGAYTVKDLGGAGTQWGSINGNYFNIRTGAQFQIGGDGNGLYFYNITDARYDLQISKINGAATFANSVTGSSFIKAGSSDSYVLLGGGGTALLSGVGGTSGEYTPSFPGTYDYNVGSYSFSRASYIRIGNIVHVSFSADIAASSGGSLCNLTFSLPIATGVVPQNGIGSVTCWDATVAGTTSGLFTVQSGTMAVISIVPTNNSTKTISGTFQYTL